MADLIKRNAEILGAVQAEPVKAVAARYGLSASHVYRLKREQRRENKPLNVADGESKQSSERKGASMEQQQTKFEAWCVVELFGHSRIVGLVSEQTIGGATFVRVDVPEVKREETNWDGKERKVYEETIPGFTKFYGDKAIYSLTPVTEAIARAMAQSMAMRPITMFELPQLKALRAGDDEDDLDDIEE